MTPADLPAPYAGPPLTVAYLGNFRHSFCTEVHVAASLEILGHRVVRIQELPAQEGGTDWASIPGIVEAKGAQLFMWTRTWPSEKADVVPVLDELRKLGCPSAFFHLDRWHGLDREHQVRDQPFALCDVIFSPNDSPKWAEEGFNHFWLPPGVYGPECEPVPPNPRRWPYDVVFVGSHPYPHPEWAKYRSDLLAAFSRAFRGRFGILPRRGVPIRGRDLQELYATVPVVLGDSCLAGESTMYWSDRIPESLGRGATLIHPEVPGMEAWYSGQRWEHGSGDLHPYAHGLSWPPDSWGDLLTYKLGDFAQAVDLAKWSLAHRESAAIVGANGRDTVTNRDTYAHRMGTVLAVAEGIHGGYRDVAHPDPSGYPIAVRYERIDPNANPPGFPIPSPAPTPRHSVRLHRWSAIFEPRPGTTDSEVIGEVWRNDYRVPSEGFSGTVVDIGANVGAFSVLAAKAGASVVRSFEPQEDNLHRLLHHRALNGLTGQITAHPEAVTDGSSEIVHMAGAGGGARHVYQTSGDPYGGSPTTTLRRILSTFGPVEFLKMDIEGGEYEAFAACPVELLARVQTIALEFHGPAMPHLSHLDDDGKHLERWGALVAKLADAGRVETFGHPMRGGLIWWRKY